MKGQIIGKKYKITTKLGSGAFGEIWKAVHINSDREVAVKFEDINSKHQQLYLEQASVLAQAIPQVIYYGTQNGKNVMIMDLLGPSLETLMNQCNKKFSVKTVLMLADQMIKRIEYIHMRRIIHRDIKPDNFAIGYKKQAHRIFILDFGLAKKYMNSKQEHIKYREGKGLTGTARYASIHTHLGVEQSRRDDLESLGSLPWQGLKAKNIKDKYRKIKETKIYTPLSELCRGFPQQFQEYLIYCRKLDFKEKPNYQMLRDQFKQLMKELGYEYDYQFDWVNQQQGMTNQNDSVQFKQFTLFQILGFIRLLIYQIQFLNYRFFTKNVIYFFVLNNRLYESLWGQILKISKALNIPFFFQDIKNLNLMIISQIFIHNRNNLNFIFQTIQQGSSP